MEIERLKMWVRGKAIVGAASPAAYVLGPPPSRSRDLELEGGVIACHVDYVYERAPRLPRTRYRVMAS